LTPILRGNFAAVVFYGLQGAILGVVFAGLKITTKKVVKEEGLRVLPGILIGAISGLLSCIPTIFITYYNAIIRSPGVVANEVKINIISELLHYLAGGMVLGAVIGLLIVFFDSKHMGEEKRDKGA
jgi:hypothetical protein